MHNLFSVKEGGRDQERVKKRMLSSKFFFFSFTFFFLSRECQPRRIAINSLLRNTECARNAVRAHKWRSSLSLPLFLCFAVIVFFCISSRRNPLPFASKAPPPSLARYRVVKQKAKRQKAKDKKQKKQEKNVGK